MCFPKWWPPTMWLGKWLGQTHALSVRYMLITIPSTRKVKMPLILLILRWHFRYSRVKNFLILLPFSLWFPHFHWTALRSNLLVQFLTFSTTLLYCPQLTQHHGIIPGQLHPTYVMTASLGLHTLYMYLLCYKAQDRLTTTNPAKR